jgi:hypothetical protein
MVHKESRTPMALSRDATSGGHRIGLTISARGSADGRAEGAGVDDLMQSATLRSGDVGLSSGVMSSGLTEEISAG